MGINLSFFEIDTQTMNLFIGLILLMLSNIFMGSVDALFSGIFDWVKLAKGIGKGFVIALSLLLAYYAGKLNPDVMIINVGDVEANLLTAIYTSVLFAFGFYGTKVITKFKSFFNVNTNKTVKVNKTEDEVEKENTETIVSEIK